MLNGTFPRGDPGSQIILCIKFQTGFRQLLWNMQIKIICEDKSCSRSEGLKDDNKS